MIQSSLSPQNSSVSLERLVDAAIGVIYDIKSEDLPQGDLRSEFDSLEALLTRMPPQLPNDGSIQATVRAMTDAEAEDTARRLAALARDVAEEAARQNPRIGSS